MKRTLAGIAVIAGLTLSLSACGSEQEAPSENTAGKIESSDNSDYRIDEAALPKGLKIANPSTDKEANKAMCSAGKYWLDVNNKPESREKLVPVLNGLGNKYLNSEQTITADIAIASVRLADSSTKVKKGVTTSAQKGMERACGL